MRKVLLLSLCLTACTDKDEVMVSVSPVLAKVGGVSVTADVFDVALKSRGLLEANAQQQQRLFDELVGEAAMANQAVKDKLPLSGEQLALLQYQQLKYQAQNAMDAYLKNNPVTDEAIKAEYDTVVKATKGLQFHVQHLLFKDEVEALKVLDEIKAGNVTFDESMSAYMSARPNMRNVGDLGWVNLQQMPLSFHQPLEQMSTDQMYPSVVLSDFGAHVLFLKDKRSVEPPSLEVARAGIKKSLEQRVKDKFKQLAVAKAKVQVLNKK